MKPFVVFTGVFTGIAIALFILNYWQASKCTVNQTADEMEEYIKGLNQRLLQAESQVQT